MTKKWSKNDQKNDQKLTKNGPQKNDHKIYKKHEKCKILKKNGKFYKKKCDLSFFAAWVKKWSDDSALIFDKIGGGSKKCQKLAKLAKMSKIAKNDKKTPLFTTI